MALATDESFPDIADRYPRSMAMKQTKPQVDAAIAAAVTGLGRLDGVASCVGVPSTWDVPLQKASCVLC